RSTTPKLSGLANPFGVAAVRSFCFFRLSYSAQKFRLSARFLKQVHLRTILRSGFHFRFRRQRQLVAESFGQALVRFERESLEVIARECPDIADFIEVPLDFKRPAFEGGFAFPKKFIVTMD